MVRHAPPSFVTWRTGNKSVLSANPTENSANPAQNSVNSAQNSVNPAENSVNPAENSVNPAQTRVNSAQNRDNPVVTTVNSTERGRQLLRDTKRKKFKRKPRASARSSVPSKLLAEARGEQSKKTDCFKFTGKQHRFTQSLLGFPLGYFVLRWVTLLAAGLALFCAEFGMVHQAQKCGLQTI